MFILQILLQPFVYGSSFFFDAIGDLQRLRARQATPPPVARPAPVPNTRVRVNSLSRAVEVFNPDNPNALRTHIGYAHNVDLLDTFSLSGNNGLPLVTGIPPVGGIFIYEGPIQYRDNSGNIRTLQVSRFSPPPPPLQPLPPD